MDREQQTPTARCGVALRGVAWCAARSGGAWRHVGSTLYSRASGPAGHTFCNDH